MDMLPNLLSAATGEKPVATDAPDQAAAQSAEEAQVQSTSEVTTMDTEQTKIESSTESDKNSNDGDAVAVASTDDNDGEPAAKRLKVDVEESNKHEKPVAMDVPDQGAARSAEDALVQSTSETTDMDTEEAKIEGSTDSDKNSNDEDAVAVTSTDNYDGEPASKRLKVDVDESNAPASDSAPAPQATEQEQSSPQSSPTSTNKNGINWLLSDDKHPLPLQSPDVVYQQVRESREAFIATLTRDSQLDVKCKSYKRWYAAKIVAVSQKKKKFKIHFQGFSVKQDKLYSMSDVMHLAPEGTYVAQYDKTVEPPPASAEDADLGGTAERDTQIALAKMAERKKKREAKPPAPKKKVKGKHPEVVIVVPQAIVEEPTADDDDESVVAKPEPKTKSKKKKAAPVPVEITLESLNITREELPLWIASRNTIKPTGDWVHDLNNEQQVCQACLEVEDADMSEYVLCDGGCLGSYHQSCVGISSEDQLGDSWFCELCRDQENECFICHKNGKIGETLAKCSMEDCGKFYHPECVLVHPLTHIVHKNKTLRCPRHVCAVCDDSKKNDGLMKCLYCSASYHPKCVPPSSLYNSMALVCGKHRAQKLPSIPDFYGQNAVKFDGVFKFPPLFLPSAAPAADFLNALCHFRLPMAYLNESNAQPPRFTKLRRNQYQFKAKKLDMTDLPSCQCKETCNDECINRVSFVECVGGGAGTTNDKKKNVSNCRVGVNCGNRALQEMVLPKTKVIKTVARGFGLKVLESVKEGQLVIEYVGEVLTEEMKRARLIDHAEKNPHDPNYYIMQLDKNEFLDGRFKGSDSRFINHSCDPNCHLLKWEVGEYRRIAITALRDIAADEELSYDYQMETNSTDSFKCHCGAPKCRGTMAPDNLNWEAHAKMKKAEDAAKKSDKKKGKKKRKRTNAVKTEVKTEAGDLVKTEASDDVKPEETAPGEGVAVLSTPGAAAVDKTDANVNDAESDTSDEATTSSGNSPVSATSPIQESDMNAPQVDQPQACEPVVEPPVVQVPTLDATKAEDVVVESTTVDATKAEDGIEPAATEDVVIADGVMAPTCLDNVAASEVVVPAP
ncbi:Aste57867_1641 [Aphanomyces stellatus]|uniref:Aste57867_1641 protein n=1 Tax=Aphanomyces stellatus TaxID=120398 RepID=A0A485K8C0_9STRA|nr:hypothetical protein As57867_001639 [Aphanomyces stellatus]VFT78854.1 Aste57867_1641 [Aphanomyces stellatus]